MGLSRRDFLRRAGAALAQAQAPSLGLPIRLAWSSDPPVVAIDPGHGGRYTGAVLRGPRGVSLVESEANLDVALRLAALLEQAGLTPVLTRAEDTEVASGWDDFNEDGRLSEDDDLQARVDLANAAGARLFFSIHHNGGPASMRGTSAFYCRDHPLSDEAAVLAEMLQQHFLWVLAALGYHARDLGALDDAMLRKPYGHLFLAGPATPRVARPSLMPTVVGEALFVTNPVEGELLRHEDVRQALAGAYLQAALQFLRLEIEPPELGELDWVPTP